MTPNTEPAAPEVPAAIPSESPPLSDKTVWIADLDTDDVLVGFR